MKPLTPEEAEREAYKLGQSFREHRIARFAAREQIKYTLPAFIGPVWDHHRESIIEAYWAGYEGGTVERDRGGTS